MNFNDPTTEPERQPSLAAHRAAAPPERGPKTLNPAVIMNQSSSALWVRAGAWVMVYAQSMMCAEDRVDELTMKLNELRLMVGNARHGRDVAGEVAAELRQALAAETGDVVSLPAVRVRLLAEMLLGVSLGVHSPASFAMSRTTPRCKGCDAAVPPSESAAGWDRCEGCEPLLGP